MHPAELNPEQAPQLQPAVKLPEMQMVEKVNPEEDLALVRNMRACLFNMIKDKNVTGDIELFNAVRGLLKEIDGSALAAIRIKVDAQKGTDEDRTRALASAMLDLIHERRVPAPKIEEVTDVTPRVIPVLPDTVVTRDFVPGEMDQGTINQNFEDFQRNHGEVKLSDNPDTDDL